MKRFATLALSVALCTSCASVFAQGAWKQGPPIPQGANEVIGANVGGSVLVYGGQDPAGKPMGIFWKFDPPPNQWTQLPSNPVPVHHGAAAAAGNRLYVFGGFRLPQSGQDAWWPQGHARGYRAGHGARGAPPPL